MSGRRQFKARPTTYKGVQMRSRLEAGYAMWLDEWEMPWEYEPQAFASSAGQYLPDFLIRNVALMDGMSSRIVDVYVEVKPPDWVDKAEDLARRMAIIWDSFPDPVTPDSPALDSPTPPLLVVESPGMDPRMIDLGEYHWRSKSPTLDWAAMAWTYVMERPSEEDPCLGLVYRLLDTDRPWQPGYWKGPQ